MNPRYPIAVGLATLILASGAVGAAYVTGSGPFASTAAPELTSFETTSARCSTGNVTGGGLELRPDDGVSHLTVNDTVEVPDLAHGVGNATVERTGPANYTLSIETVEANASDGGGVGAQCLGTVRYVANVTIPQDADERFTVVVQVDGETTHVLRNGPDGSGVGAESSAGADR